MRFLTIVHTTISNFVEGFMKLEIVLLSLCLGFSTQVWSKNSVSSPELGAVVVKDVTNLYPQINYYDQMQECNDNGATALGGPGSTTPVIGGTPSIGGFLPPAIGGATGNSEPGVIVIQPPGAAGNGSTGGFPGSGFPGGSIGFPGTGMVIIDQIVNLGNFVWQIVQGSRPTMRISTYRAHGLPKGITCWTDLEEWKVPKSKVFSVEQKSKMGQSLAKFTFRISFVYGGNYNGVGHYLANVTVTPVDVQVAWGVDFASEVHIPSVFNMGTKANPLAAMQVFVFWNLGNAFKMQQKSQLFHVTGEGLVQVTPQD